MWQVLRDEAEQPHARNQVLLLQNALMCSIMLYLGQSSVNMVFSSLCEVFYLEVVWVHHLKIRSKSAIGSWPLLCVG